MSQVKFNLIEQRGPTPGKIYELTGHELTIGRDVDNEITINDVEVSRHHVRLVRSGDTYTVQDLGSTNGTFVDEQRVSGSVPLKTGMSIRIGDNVFLLFEIENVMAQTIVSQNQSDVPKPNPQPARQRPSTQTRQPQRATPQRPVSQYAGQVPQSPDMEAGSLNWRWIGIGCGVLLIFLACIIISLLVYVDMNNLWCDWLGWLIPNRCPIA